MITPEYTLDNAVRYICSVSVTAAPKSKVREIIERLLISRERLSAKKAAEAVIRALENSSTFEYGIGKQTQTELLAAVRAEVDKIAK
jgi:hypothetical protein